MTSQEENYLLKHDIIGIQETFITTEKGAIPHFLKQFDHIFHPGTKTSRYGRASGGISIFIKKNRFKKINKMNITENWIFIRYKTHSNSYIIGTIYLKPNYDMEQEMTKLEDYLTHLQELYPKDKIITGGDYNARIGDLNQYEEEMLVDTNLEAKRKSQDQTINRRGRRITEIMESQGFLITNGRSLSDREGEATCITYNGKSTIDLVWINQESITDFIDLEVSSVSFVSGHLLCSVRLAENEGIDYSDEFKNNTCYIIKENEINKLNYQINLSNAKENLYFYSEDPTYLYNNLKETMKSAALNSQYMIKITHKNKRKNKTWYNSSCKWAKKNIKTHYRIWRNDKTEKNLKTFIKSKKEYSNIIKQTKNNYHKKITNQMAEIKNGTQFWSLVRKIRNRKNNSDNNEIEMEEWVKFYEDFYDQKTYNLNINKFITPIHPFLDQPITLDEIKKCLKKAKSRKSPGLDEIKNEMYKFLTPEWLHYLQNMFNVIFEKEKVPQEWGKIKMRLIHKKGNLNNPINYRNIALINCITKLFNNILTERIKEWAEKNNIISETQAGFRKNRGCMDNLFVLSSAIANNIRLKGRYLFAIFVDFEKAFDSIEHTRLYENLLENGLSGKLINIIKDIYDKSMMVVNWREEISKEIKITKGILQGDPLSPYLFSLFINDLGKYFRKRGHKGVNMDDKNEIIELMFADDLVLLSDTEIETKKLLQTLESYANQKGLKVNLSKTKILPFRKSPKCKKLNQFDYKGKKVDIVNEYTYLGVPFSISGKFNRATESFMAKATVAFNNVRSILITTKSDSWETKIKLQNAIINSTLLYAAELWALRYGSKLGQTEAKYKKSLLQLPKTTPNDYIYLETGNNSVEESIMKKTISWWNKLRDMPENRLPKVCLKRLIHLDSVTTNKEDINWYTQFKNLLKPLNIEPHEINKKNVKLIIEKYTTKQRNEVKIRLENSHYSETYKRIYPETGPAKYLLMRNSISKHRIIAQLRLANESHFIQIIYKENILRINPQEICSVCNLKVSENLKHIVTECPMYHTSRENHIKKYMQNNSLAEILKIETQEHVNDVYHFIVEVIKRRLLI